MKYKDFLLLAACSILLLVFIQLDLISDSSLNSNNVTLQTGEPPPPHNTNDRVLVMYPYVERKSKYDYKKSLQYFLDFGVDTRFDHVDYLLIIQGGKVSVPLPKDNKHVIVLNRSNDCFDFGAYGKAIEFLGGIDALAKYKYFIFALPSAYGPILPKYWPGDTHWSEVFVSQMRHNCSHLIAASFACLGRSHPGGHGPRFFGHAFAATYTAIRRVHANGTVFACHKTKLAAILNGEYAFSRVVVESGLNMGSLSMKFGEQIDFRDRKNWDCKWIYGFDSDPYESVFFKPLVLDGERVLVNTKFNETHAILDWRNEQVQNGNRP